MPDWLFHVYETVASASADPDIALSWASETPFSLISNLEDIAKFDAKIKRKEWER